MEPSIRYLAATLLLGCAAALAAPPATRLEADYAAWHSARAAYDEQLRQGRLDPAEAQDYRRFLADLRQRVAAGCADLHARDQALPDGVTCPAAAPAAAVPETPATTRAEGRAALDAELRQSLGAFDERLLREQDRVRAARPIGEPPGGGQDASGDGASAAVGVAPGDAAAPGGEEAGAAGDAAGGSGSTATADGGAAAAPGAAGQGPTTGQDGAPAPPAALPDPSGDDIVARQLREAAVRERDPELRARLWDEYRRYRSGIQ
jgi:hypothetical protein